MTLKQILTVRQIFYLVHFIRLNPQKDNPEDKKVWVGQLFQFSHDHIA
jgi:hypothetical protein